MNLNSLGVISLLHYFVDSYASVFGPLVALARLDPARIGILAMLYSASTSFSQLAFGYLSDRLGSRRFVGLGLMTSAIALSVAGLLIERPMLLALVLVVGGLGVAAFHPAGAVLAAKSLPHSPTWGVSVFITTGTTGFALGPVLYVLFAEQYGLESTWWLMLPGLLVLPLLWVLPDSVVSVPSVSGDIRQRVQTFLTAHGPALMPIYVFVVVRSAVQISLTSFVPSIMLERGHPTTAAGLSAMCFSGAGALGMLVWGMLAGRCDRRLLQVISVVGGVPVSLLFLYADDVSLPASLALLSLAGFFILSTNTMHIVMGQELSPENASTISSIVMGFGWGAGSAGPVIVGGLSQSWSLELSLALVCLMPALTLPLALFLRGRPLVSAAGGMRDEG
ncbi:MAG: MFS transporter [Fuerstiella sp.]|nr:MFS transporter [Fuerstiella sp.]